MNSKSMIAIILITLGIVVLCYSGITYTTRGKPVKFLGLQVETTQKHVVPPVAGAIALVGGIVLLMVNVKKKD